jgi:hypothetical protein
LQVNTATSAWKAVQYMETDRFRRDGGKSPGVPITVLLKSDQAPAEVLPEISLDP